MDVPGLLCESCKLLCAEHLLVDANVVEQGKPQAGALRISGRTDAKFAAVRDGAQPRRAGRGTAGRLHAIVVLARKLARVLFVLLLFSPRCELHLACCAPEIVVKRAAELVAVGASPVVHLDRVTVVLCGH